MLNKRHIDHKLQWGSVGDCQDIVTAIRHVQRFDISSGRFSALKKCG